MTIGFGRTTRRGEALPPWSERLEALRSLPEIVRLIVASDRRTASWVILLRVIGAIVPLAQLWIAKLVIDHIVSHAGASASWRPLGALIGIELVLVLLQETVTRYGSLLETVLSDRLARHLSASVMGQSMSLGLDQVESAEVRDEIQRATVQAGGRSALLGQLLGVMQQSISILSLFAAVVGTSPGLALLLLAAVTPSFVGETHHASLGHAFFFTWTKTRREMDYLRRVASDIGMAKEIRLWGLADFFQSRFDEASARYLAENEAVQGHRVRAATILGWLSTLGHYVAVAVFAAQALTGAITIGTFTFLIGVFQRARNSMAQLLSTSARLYEDSLFARDMFRFLERCPPRIWGFQELPEGVIARAGIRFEGVSFRYPGQDRWAVRNLTLSLNPGERMALVGPNGAGKTTMVKLLTGLYVPDTGAITVDGVSITDYSVESLRKRIGAVFQDFARFDLTAGENIGIGRVEAIDNLAEIVRAAERGRATELISRLPAGYSQLLGREFEGGVHLSGGEWQRLALSRAYMREAELIVLDEPTSSLDAEAEYQLFREFLRITTEKVALLVSHRFSTVRAADRILVLQDGSIIEDGSHADLMVRAGLYARMFRLQASQYSTHVE